MKPVSASTVKKLHVEQENANINPLVLVLDIYSLAHCLCNM